MAPDDVKKVIDMFEKTTNEAFRDCRKKPPITNMKKKVIGLLKKLKKDQKYIIIAANKNLGPCILDIKLYSNRCLGDHLNNKDVYEEVSPTDTLIIQEKSFRWICEHFTDTSNVISKSDRKFFKETLVGDRDAMNIQHLQKIIEFAYFYTIPKRHEKP